MGQLGTFSRAQALDAGLSNRQLRGRVRSGLLEQPGPNAFRIAGSPPTPRSQLHELLLDVGQPAWVAGPTAAALHGFDGFRVEQPFHLVLPAKRNVRRSGAVIHRSERLTTTDTCIVHGLAATSIVRTIIDMARWAPRGQLERLVEHAISSERLTEEQLFGRIGSLRSQGRYGIPLLLEVLEHRELTRGGESWLEREYLLIIAEASLPRPDTQVVLARTGDRVVRVDCYFPGTEVVVELLGYRYHRTRSQMNRDATRHNALLAVGKSVYQFAYDQVTSDRGGVIEQPRTALSRARRAA